MCDRRYLIALAVLLLISGFAQWCLDEPEAYEAFYAQFDGAADAKNY